MKEILLLEMDFTQVIKTCLKFSTNNNGTIQSYPAGCNNQLDVQSRTNHTEIHVEQVKPGVWNAEQTQNAVGEKNQTSETVSTEEHLLEYLSRYWDDTQQ